MINIIPKIRKYLAGSLIEEISEPDKNDSSTDQGCIRDLEKRKKDALLYKTRYEWKRASPAEYNDAKKNNWLSICCDHMKAKTDWSFEECRQDSLLYTTRGDWHRNSPRAYRTAKNKDWLDKLSTHMIKSKHKTQLDKYQIQSREAEKLSSDILKINNLKAVLEKNDGSEFWLYVFECEKVNRKINNKITEIKEAILKLQKTSLENPSLADCPEFSFDLRQLNGAVNATKRTANKHLRVKKI